jgi:dihydrodipicolinate synthase/N-acetylneuraminate lyase
MSVDQSRVRSRIAPALKTQVEPPRRKFSGIVPPMITPLAADNELDLAGLERLIEHMIGGGIHGLFVLGSTGEGPILSYELRRKLIESSVRIVKGRIPVLIGITDPSPVETLRMARFSADAGADVVVTSAPYYFRIRQDELLEYVVRFAMESPLPVMLYNIPQLTKTWFDVDTVRMAFELQNVIGIKDSSGDTDYFKQLIALTSGRTDLCALIGKEELLLESIGWGGHGSVCGGANMFPGLYVDLYEACLAGDIRLAKQAHDDLMEVSKALYTIMPGDYAGIKAAKCALSILGICSATLGSPLLPLTAEEKGLVARRLSTLSRLTSIGIQSAFQRSDG